MTNARQAYEEDVRRQPLYHDGTPRIGWDNLSAQARDSWIKNPTPREWKMGKPLIDARDGGTVTTAAERAAIRKAEGA